MNYARNIQIICAFCTVGVCIAADASVEVSQQTNDTGIKNTQIQPNVASNVVRKSSSTKFVNKDGSVSIKSVNNGLDKGWDNGEKDNFSSVKVLSDSNANYVGDQAFSRFKKLTKVELPESVTKIGSKAFYKCTKLADVNIPKFTRIIENNAFFGCSNLKDIALPKGIQDVSVTAFDECSNLKSMTVPVSLVMPGRPSFHGASDVVEKMTILPSDIQYNVLSLYKNLRTIELSKGVTRIEKEMFKDCSNLEKLIIPDTVRYIASDAFIGCKKLQVICIETDGRMSFNKVPLNAGDKEVEVVANGKIVTNSSGLEAYFKEIGFLKIEKKLSFSMKRRSLRKDEDNLRKATQKMEDANSAISEADKKLSELTVESDGDSSGIETDVVETKEQAKQRKALEKQRAKEEKKHAAEEKKAAKLKLKLEKKNKK